MDGFIPVIAPIASGGTFGHIGFHIQCRLRWQG